MMTPAMRADLAGREQDIQRGKTVELLRRAGKEMYDNPIVNTAIGFTPVLGDVQAAGETMSALNRGAPWQETAGYAVGMLPFIPMVGKTVWHGSPHTFDKFDLSKIGTGEGAQAYGHGLYLAESPDVAKGYQSSLSADRGFSFEGKSGLTRAQVQDLVNEKFGTGYLDNVLRPSGVADSFIDDMVTGLSRPEGSYPRQYKPGSERAKVYDELRGKIIHTDPGSLYKVDLPDEQIAKMLDWDKPINQQPEVMNLLGIDADKAALYEKTKQQRLSMPAQFDIDIPAEKAMYDEAIALQRQMDEIGLEKSGKKYYEDLIKKYGSYKGISDALREQGLSGIKYYDAGSRSKAQNIEDATRNYVVFSDEIPQILERNNIPVNK